MALKYGIIMSLIIIVIYRFSQLSKLKENFTWNKESTRNFLLIENTRNPDIIFDVNMIQKIKQVKKS